ncbi:anhydro-N-acetylmuramic acid kinase [Paenibacillus rhizophilus]|uniref:Anhydro-N-acetylmuramic acid kinase n=1 Tax=Paenibacillus rhizophilus TaxID=1850366 RepID=A0A3N9P963_9BACL|nr:anhydro-N-acetylmuramic acid kinase [Paenibacillus rhizophilus]RQW12778.1 anhydro-N-acetylmuramic acid kinase [Paenibacillus rhizophilus]
MIGPLWNKRRSTVLGLMSGTSLDGIDAAIVSIEGAGLEAKAKLLHYYSVPYDEALRERLKELCTTERSSVDLVCGMNVYLAEKFAEASIAAVRSAGMDMEDIDLISSHGQTVWHIPEGDSVDPYKVRSTLQLGDLSVLAKRTGRPVVGDFRPADMAVGGQGAPLAPYGDLILFRHPSKGRLLQNIGGIGNCTALPAFAGPEDVFAFDTGPGNMVIDQAVYLLSDGKLTYDEGGSWAAQGHADEALVAEMLDHPYFAAEPPKSTGRELFGKAYAAEFVSRTTARGLSESDIVATATAFTARTITEGCKRFVFPRCAIDEVIVSGGGAHNRTLLNMIQQQLPGQAVRTSGELGVSDDAKEAVIFALLGNDFMHGISNHLPSATGADRSTVLGKLALP